MQGEAFFDIERNEDKPFIIDLPAEAYVKVLGTSFNIKAIEGDSLIEVFVNTGKVEFGSAGTSIILMAGEKGVMNTHTGEVYPNFSTTAGVKEMYWIDQEIRFDAIPLYEVVNLLNEIFDDEVTIACDGLRDIRHRSNHSNDSLNGILTTIAKTHNFEFEESIVDGKKEFTLNCK